MTTQEKRTAVEAVPRRSVKEVLNSKWCGMKRRCQNPNDVHYHAYGAKGITVSDDWQKFDNFFRDMEGTYFPGASIDRINNTKGYSKENCRWADSFQQARNKSNVRKYHYRGREYTIPELAEIAGIHRRTIYARLKVHGWSVEDAVGTPVDLANKYLRHPALANGQVLYS